MHPGERPPGPTIPLNHGGRSFLNVDRLPMDLAPTLSFIVDATDHESSNADNAIRFRHEGYVAELNMVGRVGRRVVGI